MATILLIVIYLAFIGLGLPDSLFGAAWPAIYAEYNLPLSFGSFLTVLSFLGTGMGMAITAALAVWSESHRTFPVDHEAG